jgi:hypothetical protein
MKTTLIKLISLSVLLGLALTFTATIGFAKTKKKKTEPVIATQQQQVVGLVEHINKDRTFDLVSLNGQRYHVHMGKEALVNAYGNSSFGKRIMSFDDLYSGARISFTAISNEATYVVNDK